MVPTARTVIPVLVVVVLAGCSGTAPGATTPATDASTTQTTTSVAETTTATTADSTTTTTATASDDAPPGIENGTVALNASTTIAVASNPDVYFVESTRTGASVVDRDVSTYANGSIVARHPAENGSYYVVHTPQGEPATPASLYPGVPRNVDAVSLLLASSEETTATRVDADTYRVTAEGASIDAVTVDAVELDDVSNVTLDLYVTESGRMLNYTVAFDATKNGEALAGESRVSYVGVGTTSVETPTWFLGNATSSNATRLGQ